MSFASDFREALRQETDEELRRMASEDTFLAALARGEMARRAREVSNG